jgi:pyruvate/2-oxoglutarate dehydrogenase complex dihydrolipoamide acyltransferase (E2) component
MTNKFEITIPQLSVNDTSLTVSKIYVETGNLLKIGDPILSVESSKTTEDIFAEQDGYIYLRCEEGCDYDVNTVIGILSDEVINESAAIQQVSSNSNNLNEEIITPNIAPIVSLAAESLMLQNNLSIQDFYGLLFVDINAVNVKLGRSIVKVETSEKKAKPSIGKAVVPVNVDVIPVGKQKKLEIEYLSQVQQTGLTSTIHVQVKSAGISSKIDNSLKYFKGQLLPVIVYETSRLLKLFPKLNGYYDNGNMMLYHMVNLGFAVDMEMGLKVLKIDDTVQYNLSELDQIMFDLANKYIDDKLATSDLTEITFTVSDLSMEGVFDFRPLVNANNSAILGVSSIDFEKNQFNLSLTFDHRMTEGRYASQFLKDLKARLESYCVKSTDHIICYKCQKHLSEDLNDRGFLKVVRASGDDSFICDICYLS